MKKRREGRRGRKMKGERVRGESGNIKEGGMERLMKDKRRTRMKRGTWNVDAEGEREIKEKREEGRTIRRKGNWEGQGGNTGRKEGKRKGKPLHKLGRRARVPTLPPPPPPSPPTPTTLHRPQSPPLPIPEPIPATRPQRPSARTCRSSCLSGRT